MRLDRVFIDGFKNLNGVEVNFDESRLTTVIIGQNGTGKSNLIEAITDVFRYVDLNRGVPRYGYEIDYRIGNHVVHLSNREGSPTIAADGRTLARSTFEREKNELFPDLVFGYYSGGSRRLEKLFDNHQRRYYDAIKVNDDAEGCRRALTERRLFYCRPIHGIFALLSIFAFPDPVVTALLRDKLCVTGFHSALAHFKEPWFAKGGQATKIGTARDLWGAKGPAGACARGLRDAAFHPLALTGNAIDDYRDKQQVEAQFACFLRNSEALRRFSSSYTDDRDLFAALESADISDLFRDLYVWVMRTTDATGDVSFADLSDGERQLLMVLGLIRISRGKRALFLLDEPDTHLNPVWQYTYLDLIQEWTGVAADSDNCHIILSTHNPLVIGGLRRNQVRVLSRLGSRVVAAEPEHDPIGVGVEGLLKSELYGLRSSLAPEILQKLDRHYILLGKRDKTSEEQRELMRLAAELNDLSVSRTHPNPYFESFANAMARRRQPEPGLELSKAEIDDQAKLADDILKEVIADEQVGGGGQLT